MFLPTDMRRRVYGISYDVSQHYVYMAVATYFYYEKVHRTMLTQRQPSRGVLKKRCSENIQETYRRIPMPNCFATLLKSHFSMGIFLQICSIFSEHLFLKTRLDGYFCLLQLCHTQAGTNYILPAHKRLCTRRCFQCTIVHIKIVYSCRRHALKQKYQQKRPFGRLYIKYR